MAKNYMADVAKMLGVEFDERFEITEHGKTFTCYLKPDGLYKLLPEGPGTGKTVLPYILTGVLTGEFEFKKLPWRPKTFEGYYYVYWHALSDGWKLKVGAAGEFQISNAVDTLRVDTGNCFKSYDEAEAQKYEVFKRLTGKDWHESRGKGYGSNEAD